MKKVAIISRHSVPNYGSLLQAYALQVSVERLGMEAIHIDYTNKDEQPWMLGYTRFLNRKNQESAFRKITYLVLQVLNSAYTFNRFKGYRSRVLKQTKIKYQTESELQTNLPIADIYCTGSDQVWNTINRDEIDPAYFLSFVPENLRKVSYAASFGRGKLTEEMRAQVQPYLSRYDNISVRENSGKDILKAMQLKAEQVLDPTLLLDKKFWTDFAIHPKIQEPYILLYQLRKNDEYIKCALELQKRMGIRLVRISSALNQYKWGGEFVFMPSPKEFLGYIANARIMLTDSFHGTAFAINCNTPFIEMAPDRFAARNKSLLETFNLQERLISSLDQIDVLENEIDYSTINDLLEKERKSSFQYLRHALS